MKTEEFEEEESLIITHEIMQDEMLEMGLADQEEVNLSKSKSRLSSTPAKADLASFDREKFYRRIGVFDVQ